MLHDVYIQTDCWDTERALWKMQYYLPWLARFSLRGKLRMSSAAKLQTPTSFSVLVARLRETMLGVSCPSVSLNTPNNPLCHTNRPYTGELRHISIGCVPINMLVESSSEIVKCNFPCFLPSRGFVQSAGWLWRGQTKFTSEEIRAVSILQVHSKCAPNPWWEQRDSNQWSAFETALNHR